MTTHEADDIRSAVQERYANAARNVSSCCGLAVYSDTDPFGQFQYDESDRALLPNEAITASLGCGNPTLLAELKPGDVVLDLGSGGGIDVLLSARRVAPGGKAYGLDMTPEMLELAEANKAKAGIENVEFLLGTIEDIPLPDDSVDVIISNCVVNLSADKGQVFREAFRVLRPGGRLAISDVVLSRPLSPALTEVMALWTGCITGALVENDAIALMEAAGFEQVGIEPTNVFGRTELEGLAAGLRPEDLAGIGDLDRLVAEFDGVIRSASLRATKPRPRPDTDPGTPEPHRATQPQETLMPSVHVYEPALCCNTGVCGEDVDQRLVEFTADLNHLTEQGANIARHNLANDPLAFASDDSVRGFLEVAGSEGLPLTAVDGVTVLTGAYPTRDQLLRYTGLTQAPVAAPAGATELTVTENTGCGSTGCC